MRSHFQLCLSARAARLVENGDIVGTVAFLTEVDLCEFPPPDRVFGADLAELWLRGPG
jgi:hypothetical protein